MLQPGSRFFVSARTARRHGLRYRLFKDGSEQFVVVRFEWGSTQPASTAALGEGTLMKTSHSHRMGRVPALVCLTILALLAQGCTRDPNVRKGKYLNSGKAYAAQGKEKEAIIQFSNAIKIDPHYAAAHFELAKAYIKNGSAMGGYTELRHTVDLDPKNIEARLDLAQIYLAGRQYPRALEQVNAILALDPKNADAWAVKSGIASANNDHEEALKDIQQALTYAPDRAGFHAQLGLIQSADPSTATVAVSNVSAAVKLD